MNRLCIENGFDHMFEPRTHEDTVMFTQLEHCKKKEIYVLSCNLKSQIA